MTRVLYLDYLRLALILLIVFEHASLAYMPNVSLSSLNIDKAVFYVTDPDPSGGIFFFLQSFRLSFVIPLLFFISGLFFEKSIQHRTILQYLKTRFVRIGIPLLIIAFVFAPFMAYVSYLQLGKQSGFYAFLTDFFMYDWYIGHGWFLWVLLLFECFGVCWRKYFPKFYYASANLTQYFAENRFVFISLLFIFTYLAYFASVFLLLDEMQLVWHVLAGPFSFIMQNILACFLFFILGVLLGEGHGTSRLANIERIYLSSPFLYLIFSAIFLTTQYSLLIVPGNTILTLGYPSYQYINALTTPVLCVLLSLAVLSVFYRYCHAFSRVGQFFAGSSYVIYIVHLPVCVCVQYLLLPLDISVYIKWLMVAATGIVVSELYYMGLVWVRKMWRRSDHEYITRKAL